MNSLLADLHVHTVLSPCAEVEMIPPLIVQRALALGLGLIAVTELARRKFGSVNKLAKALVLRSLSGHG